MANNVKVSKESAVEAMVPVVPGVRVAAVMEASTGPAADAIIEACAPILDTLDSVHSRRAYGRALGEFVEWWRLGGWRHATPEKGPVDYAVVSAWRTELRDGVGVRGKKLAPQSINQRLAAVRALVRELAIRGVVSHETAAAVGQVRSVRAAGVRAGLWLTRVEVEKLLAAPDTRTVKGVRDAAMLRVMLGCALRREDVVGLRGETLTQVGGRWVLLNLKGKGGRVGTVPVPGWAAEAVQQWWVVRRLAYGGVFGVEDTDAALPVFTTTRRRADKRRGIGGQTVANIVKQYGAAIGRPELAAHDLRRTFAMQSARDGADMHQIQMTLRHADLSTTNKYLGAQQDMNRAPCDALSWEVPGLGDAVNSLDQLTRWPALVCKLTGLGDGGDGDGDADADGDGDAD